MHSGEAMSSTFSVQWRFVLPWAAACLLAFSSPFAFTGCNGCRAADGCHDECSSDGDCAEGEVCTASSWDAGRRCLVACTASTECKPEWACICDATSATSGRCDIPELEEPDQRREGVCAGDLDTPRLCADLCACPCSFADKCPGARTGPECRSGCEAAYADFTSCRAELDAYYECAYRKAVCAADSAVTTGCVQNYPFCWGVSPEQACPSEQSALEACAKASWDFFYPAK